jgi:hypothetical protein
LASSSETSGVSLEQRAVYRILVQGVVPEKFADRLGGLRLQVGPGFHGGSATTLTGRLTDQAQLIGVLNALYEMHLPILCLELLEVECPAQVARGTRGCR